MGRGRWRFNLPGDLRRTPLDHSRAANGTAANKRRRPSELRTIAASFLAPLTSKIHASAYAWIAVDTKAVLVVAESVPKKFFERPRAHASNAQLRLLCEGALRRQHSTAQACGGCQIACCTAESRSPPLAGLWQRWVINSYAPCQVLCAPHPVPSTNAREVVGTMIVQR